MITPPKLGIAVPKYIEEKALKANMPPGHRFNLYAPMWVKEVFLPKENIWGIGEDITEKKDRTDKFSGKIIEEGHEKRDGGKAETLKRASEKYADEIKKLLKSTCERQNKQAQKLDALIIPIKLTAPFAVGLGNEHPVENGFSFLSPYGLPYIAGSGIKGVLRNSAQESDVSSEEIEVLFGKEDQNDATCGALTFWDGFPQCDRMTVEVMTPHQSDYYQGKSSPHDQGTPTPIQFLAVPANTNMNLIIQCDTTMLKQQDYDWQAKVIEIVDYASKWLGFGAKTSVGYGSFVIDNDSLNKQKEIQNKKEEEKKLASLSPEEREKQNAISELNNLIAEIGEIKKNEKNYKPESSKINSKLSKIYEVCRKLKDEKSRSFLEDIFAFVKSNNNKKKELKQKIGEIFG